MRPIRLFLCCCATLLLASPARADLSLFDYEPTEKLDVAAYMFMSARLVDPDDRWELPAGALSGGLSGWFGARDSPVSVGGSWQVELGLDDSLGVLFDLQGGVGPAFNLGRLSAVAMGMVGADRFVLRDSGGDAIVLTPTAPTDPVVPGEFTYGLGARLYLEVDEELAFDLEGSLLRRTGEGPGEKRVGLRLLSLGRKKDALFFGARYVDYGAAYGVSLFFGYGSAEG